VQEPKIELDKSIILNALRRLRGGQLEEIR